MKVLWLSHLVPYPPKAGVIQRSYHLLRQLSKHHQVHLLAFHQERLMAPLVPTLEEGLVDARRALGEFCEIEGIFPIPAETHYLGNHRLALMSIFSRHGYNLSWLICKAYKKAIEEVLAKIDFDLVHLDTISFAPYLPLFAGKPVVLDHHNIESHMMLRRASEELNFGKKWYFRLEAARLARAERWACRLVNLNITCSVNDSNRLLRVCSNARVEDVANGVDTAYFSPARDSTVKQRLIFVGTMSWYPNIQAARFLIEELAELIDKDHPELSIDIVGAGAPKDLISSAKLKRNVNMHGFIDDIRPLMNEALAVICPIRDGGGTKLKIVDALSMGVPVIADPIACEGINVVDGVSVLYADDKYSYLRQLSKLKGSIYLQVLLGKNGRTLAKEKYSTDAIGRRLRLLYEDVLRSASTDAGV